MPVQVATIPVESSWGVQTWNLLITHQPPSSTLTVLFPGTYYPCEAPLLWYARKGAASAGSDVLALEYGYWAAHAEPDFDADWKRIVAEAVTAIERVRFGAQYRRLVFVSKSIGTYMAGQAATRISDVPIRHLFMTPIPLAISLMQEHGGSVVVGERDPTFTSEHIAQISDVDRLSVTVVPGANHNLEIDGDIDGSLRILRQVAETSAELVRAEP